MAIRSLLQLRPKQARVKREDKWIEIDLEEIKIGDLFHVRPAETIPIDGEVVEGESYIDESLVTGESQFVHKVTGDKLFSGTSNQQGSLIGKATTIGSETMLSAMIQLVQEAITSRAPIQKLARQPVPAEL